MQFVQLVRAPLPVLVRRCLAQPPSQLLDPLTVLHPQHELDTHTSATKIPSSSRAVLRPYQHSLPQRGQHGLQRHQQAVEQGQHSCASDDGNALYVHYEKKMRDTSLIPTGWLVYDAPGRTREREKASGSGSGAFPSRLKNTQGWPSDCSTSRKKKKNCKGSDGFPFLFRTREKITSKPPSLPLAV